jgi:hypothetical protein
MELLTPNVGRSIFASQTAILETERGHVASWRASFSA